MEPLQLLLWSVILYVVGGVIALFLKKQEGLAILISGISAIIGGVLGILSALPVIFGGEIATFTAAGAFRFCRLCGAHGYVRCLYGVRHFITGQRVCALFSCLCARI